MDAHNASAPSTVPVGSLPLIASIKPQNYLLLSGGARACTSQGDQFALPALPEGWEAYEGAVRVKGPSKSLCFTFREGGFADPYLPVRVLSLHPLPQEGLLAH